MNKYTFFKIFASLSFLISCIGIAAAQPSSERKDQQVAAGIRFKNNVDFIDTLRLNSDKDKYELGMSAWSKKSDPSKDIRIYVHGKTLDGKYDNVELSKVKQHGEEYIQEITPNIDLKIGKNDVRIDIVGEDNRTVVKSYKVVIEYNPTKMNLHVLAIGPKHHNLQYTSKDAQDFVDAFKNQEGLFFKKVFTYCYTTDEETLPNKLKEAFIDFKRLYQDGSEAEITDKDMLIIFISSHGKKQGDKFKLQTGGHRIGYPVENYLIDYQEDVMNQISHINCKKLVFIDACQSGAAYSDGGKTMEDEKLAEALHKLLEAKPGLATITSCQENEKSYEDEKWKNGAFTAAILNAFNNTKVNEKMPDTDKDGILQLGELQDYISATVPFLVKNVKKNYGTQKPQVVKDELDKDIPIYALEYYKPKKIEIIEEEEIMASIPSTSASLSTYPSSRKPASWIMDTDGDGLVDKVDDCPENVGLPSKNGCPETLKKVTGPMTGKVIDERDKQPYTWAVLKDGKRWMTQNLNVDIKTGSLYYNNKQIKHNKQQGRLYTWSAAQEACPKGWRLPTNHDWQNLIAHYGGEKEAYFALMRSEPGEFSAQLTGIRKSNNDFCCDGHFGSYWSKSSTTARAGYMHFNKNSNKAELSEDDKNYALSCRCIQD